MKGIGVVIIIILVLAAIGALGWLVVYPRWRARKLGLPPPPLNPFASQGSSALPTPRSGGVVGWVKDKIGSMGNKRYASGSYEGGGRGNHHPLDPDEAWDARVGNEADGYGAPGGYYEEQELTNRNDTGYSGAGYGGGHEEGRGRSRQRELDHRYDEEMGHAPSKGQDNPFGDGPFGDNAERSDLRGVSPRPADSNQASASKDHQNDHHSERRSLFRENV